MSGAAAFGWRPITKGFSSGLDFLGLAVPIEGILDAETSGITNATFRTRYFALVPWYYWKYAKLGGQGSEKDQRQFVIGFEMLIAYANIAWLEATKTKMAGIIRREICEKHWKEGKARLPLRGDGVGDTPSPVDAALYGPSLRRLNLLGRYGQLYTCRDAGAALAEELDKTLGRIQSCPALLEATTVERAVVGEWANHLSLGLATSRETQLLRGLFFSDGDFALPDLPPRVYTMLLLLGLALTAGEQFTSRDIEVALARGLNLQSRPFSPDPSLTGAYTRWRILILLKFLRHASELAFGALYRHIKESTVRFGTAQAAAEELIARAISEASSADTVPQRYADIVVACAHRAPPDWEPADATAVQALRHAIGLCGWCHAVVKTDSGQALLEDDMAGVGSHLDADLVTYFHQLEGVLTAPTACAMRWLCVDRGIARHFQVAARKLAQHDTFRLIEDEEGVRATDKCPIPDIAIRVDAMLSLISDLGLLSRGDGCYAPTPETRSWYASQVRRLQ
jgi:hypothetical protein